jgi:hypothetical protein
MSRTKERLEYAAALGSLLTLEAQAAGQQMYPHIVARDVAELMKLARRAERVAIAQCNGIPRFDAKSGQMVSTWTEDDEAKAEKTRANVQEKVKKIGARYDFKGCSVHGDPRGYALKIKLASGRTNNAGGDEWGVLS